MPDQVRPAHVILNLAVSTSISRNAVPEIRDEGGLIGRCLLFPDRCTDLRRFARASDTRQGRNKRVIRYRHSDFSGLSSYQNGIRQCRSCSWIPARSHQLLLHHPGPRLVARLQGLIVKPLSRRRPRACLPSSWDQLAALVQCLVPARVEAQESSKCRDCRTRAYHLLGINSQH
jgi:hypothetical protein